MLTSVLVVVKAVKCGTVRLIFLLDLCTFVCVCFYILVCVFVCLLRNLYMCVYVRTEEILQVGESERHMRHVFESVL